MNKLNRKENQFIQMKESQRYIIQNNQKEENVSTVELRLCDNMLHMSNAIEKRKQTYVCENY